MQSCNYLTNKNYTTWVKGVATNENTSIIDGDPIYLYSSADTYYIRYWNVDVPNRNISMTTGWNQITHFNTSEITTGDLCSESIYNSSSAIKYITYVNTAGTYVSHRCGFTFNNDTEVPRGCGYWLKLNASSYQLRERE